MAHYAFLNLNNTVIEVIVGKEENEDGINWENWYSEFRGMQCKRTSYNTRGGIHLKGGLPFRKNYAGIGYFYDPIRDAFIPLKPDGDFTFNEETCLWDEI